MVLKILEIAEIEGEDCDLHNLTADSKLRYELGDISKYPPRIVVAKLYLDRDWREAVLEAAKMYLKDKSS